MFKFKRENSSFLWHLTTFSWSWPYGKKVVDIGNKCNYFMEIDTHFTMKHINYATIKFMNHIKKHILCEVLHLGSSLVIPFTYYDEIFVYHEMLHIYCNFIVEFLLLKRNLIQNYCIDYDVWILRGLHALDIIFEQLLYQTR
jgi:hypothetical protein